jgi:hypothetical protein
VCFKCGEKGHKSSKCPNPPKSKKDKAKAAFICQLTAMSPEDWTTIQKAREGQATGSEEAKKDFAPGQ